jgi:hypothetical protein
MSSKVATIGLCSLKAHTDDAPEQEFRSVEPEERPVRHVRWRVAVTGRHARQAGHIRERPSRTCARTTASMGRVRAPVAPDARRVSCAINANKRRTAEYTPRRERVGRRRGTDPATLGRPSDACIRHAARRACGAAATLALDETEEQNGRSTATARFT